MAAEEGHTVYLGGLSFDSDEGAIKKVFEEFGDVLSAKLIFDRETGKPKGFGFVTFAAPESAQAAIKAMDGEVVDGRPIRVSEVRRRGEGGREGGRGEVGPLRPPNEPLHHRERERPRGPRRGSWSPNRRSPPPAGASRLRYRSRSPPTNESPPRGSPDFNAPPPAVHSRGQREEDERLGGLDNPAAARAPTRVNHTAAPPQEAALATPAAAAAAAAAPSQHLKDLQAAVESAQAEKQAVGVQMASLEGDLHKATATEVAIKERIKSLEAAKKQVAALYEARVDMHGKLMSTLVKVHEAHEGVAESKRELKSLLAPALPPPSTLPIDAFDASHLAPVGAHTGPHGHPLLSQSSVPMSVSASPRMHMPMTAMHASPLQALPAGMQGTQMGMVMGGSGMQGYPGMQQQHQQHQQQQQQGNIFLQQSSQLPILLPLQAQQQK